MDPKRADHIPVAVSRSDHLTFQFQPASGDHQTTGWQ